MSKLLVLIIFYTISLKAEEKTSSSENIDIYQQKERLSVKYTRGGHLLYDCDDGHFVCTDELEAKNCLVKREFHLLEKSEELPCVMFKKFPKEKDCLDEQKRLINRAVHVMSCKNDLKALEH